MTKAEILTELPKLSSPDRREILNYLFELEMLDHELRDYQKNPNAGSSWEEVKARVLRSL